MLARPSLVRFLAGAESLGVAAGSMVGAADRVPMPRSYSKSRTIPRPGASKPVCPVALAGSSVDDWFRAIRRRVAVLLLALLLRFGSECFGAEPS